MEVEKGERFRGGRGVEIPAGAQRLPMIAHRGETSGT